MLSQAGATSYTWDDSGNLTGRGSDTFSYDYANRLTQTVAGGVTTTYTYNGDGLRVGKSTAGSASNSLVWDVSLGLPLVISDSAYTYIYGLGPIGMVDAQGNAYYFLRDALGSITGLVDANGTLTATYSYDAYGNLRSSTGTLPNSFRYTGEWNDAETGFYYLRARYYDSAVGRFITQDPWPGNTDEPYSLNPYLYVENNPIGFVDPTGLQMGDPFQPPVWRMPWEDYLDCLNWADPRECFLFAVQMANPWALVLRPAGFKDLYGACEGAAGGSRGVYSRVKLLKFGKVEFRGFTKHGIDQVISRGIRPYEIADALRNPLRILKGRDDVVRYKGRWAELRLNAKGEIVTGIRFKPPDAP